MNSELKDKFNKNNKELGILETLIGDIFFDNIDIEKLASIFIMRGPCDMDSKEEHCYTGMLKLGTNIDMNNISVEALGKNLAERFMTEYSGKHIALYKIGILFVELEEYTGWRLYVRMGSRDE